MSCCLFNYALLIAITFNKFNIYICYNDPPFQNPGSAPECLHVCILEVNAGTAKQEVTNSATTNTLQVSMPRRSVKIMCSLKRTTLKEPVRKHKPSGHQISSLLECQRRKQRLSRRNERLSIRKYFYISISISVLFQIHRSLNEMKF